MKILLLENDAADAEQAAQELRRAGIDADLRCVSTRDEFVWQLEQFEPDIVISDYTLPGFDGLAALDLSRQRRPDTPFVFLTATQGEVKAIESLKRGAVDYVLKDNLPHLAPAIRRAIEGAHLRTVSRRAQQELEETQELFRDVLEFAPDAMVIVNASGDIKIVNAQTEVLFGYSRGELIGQPIEILLPKRVREQHVQARINYQASPQVRPMGTGRELYGRRKDGTEFAAEISLGPLQSRSGLLVLAVVRDITERKMQEAELARLSRIHAVIGDINAGIIRIRDRQEWLQETCRIAVEKGGFKIAAVLMVNVTSGQVRVVAQTGDESGLLERIGWSGVVDLPAGQGLIGEALRSLQPVFCNEVASDPRLRPSMSHLLEQGVRAVLVLPLRVANSVVGVLALLSPEANFFNTGERELLGELAADVSFALDNLDKEERLAYIAYHDVLTGLPNRTLLHDRLGFLISEAQRSGSQFAVVTLEIEQFRQVNESHGRQAGDALLQAVADRLKLFMQEPEPIARIGSDVFAALIPDMTDGPAVARLIEEKLAACLGQPIPVAGQNLLVSVRSGVALFPNDGQDAESLLKNAGAALRKAMTAGEKLVFYAPQINARVAERLAIENKLRHAVTSQQFVLHYQPKVDLRHGSVNSIEALIRWNDPDRGLVAPSEFIPILEDTGLIYEVGGWVLARAAADSAVLRGALGRAPRIAVNVSQRQLRKPTFIDDLAAAVGPRTGEPHGIDLEITESMLMEDVEDGIRKLRAARDMDFGIQIDDFGTGYSSLAYIARLPIDTLKIDRSFVMNMAGSPDDTSIVSSIISLAHALDLKVVAEGVETEEQAQLLRLLKCDEGQGYLFCRPLPLQDLIARLRAGNGRLVPGSHP